MIQIAAAVLLVLGSGLIFKALIEMDAPTVRRRPLAHGRARVPTAGTGDEPAVPLRRAA
jgi:hypothetical protein